MPSTTQNSNSMQSHLYFRIQLSNVLAKRYDETNKTHNFDSLLRDRSQLHTTLIIEMGEREH